MSALLSAPGILPFVGSVPGLAKFLPKNRSIKSIYTSGVTNKRLYTNASTMQKLVEEQNFDEAKKFIKSEMKKSGINIDNTQAEAILKAHMDVSCVVGKCNPKHLKDKLKIMKGEGTKDILKPTERRKAIELGLAGNVDEVSELANPYKKYTDFEKDFKNVPLERKAFNEYQKKLEGILEKLSDDELATLHSETIKKNFYYDKTNSFPRDFNKQLDMELNRRKAKAAKIAEQIRQKEYNEKINLIKQEKQLKLNKLEDDTRSKDVNGQILTLNQISKITDLTNKLNKNHYSELTNEDLKAINEYRDLLNAKKKWKGKGEATDIDPLKREFEFNGMKTEDNILANIFSDALDNMVTNIRNGSSHAEAIALKHSRIIQPATVEMNLTNDLGDKIRQNAVISSAFQNAKPVNQKVEDSLRAVHSIHGLSNVSSQIKFSPVIFKRDDFEKMKILLQQYSITSDELISANISSTLTFNGFEGFISNQKVLNFADKINKLSIDDKILIEASLTKAQYEQLNKLIEVVKDHSKSYRPYDVLNLKRFNE